MLRLSHPQQKLCPVLQPLYEDGRGVEEGTAKSQPAAINTITVQMMRHLDMRQWMQAAQFSKTVIPNYSQLVKVVVPPRHQARKMYRFFQGESTLCLQVV